MIEVDGRQLRLSNLDKVLYPAVGFTKGDVIDYYVRTAPVLLPHLSGRALTLKRYPEGVKGFHFYEKNCPPHRPDWMKTARVWSKGNNRFMHYCLAEDLPTLVWLGNLADLELHTSLSRAAENDQPTMVVFDLDPGPPANIVACCQVALWIRELLQGLGLQAFAKTSGSKGLQLYIPLNTPVTYDQTKPFAHAVARLLENRHPGQVVSEMKKALRPNKVFVDWSQNDSYKTTICVYSLRAKDRPTVSTPVTWQEVEDCRKKNDPQLLVFTSDQVLTRVEKRGDLFEPVLSLRQKMPKLADLEAESKREATSIAARTSKPARKESTQARRKPAKRKSRMAG
ncbi:MAG TPA: non-homologous end-joining DNA ligase [Terriglobales bacterium]|nr:non-homologous end-joining DNA ligase [Terriglobales bacterium]